MDSLHIALASMITHLAEYIETGDITDLNAARGLMESPEVDEILEPGPLLPLARSGKSVADMLSMLCDIRDDH